MSFVLQHHAVPMYCRIRGERDVLPHVQPSRRAGDSVEKLPRIEPQAVHSMSVLLLAVEISLQQLHMNEEVRLRRAKQWSTSTDKEVAPDSDHGESQPDEIKTFNFGSVPDPSFVTDTFGTTQSEHERPVEHDFVSDEEIMRRQLSRKSAPYAQVFREVKSEPYEEHTSESAAHQPPGSYPADYAADEPADIKVEQETNVPEAREDPDSRDERTCRICFSPEAPDERLISPCKCRGTSKWIHISCLDQWRMHSQNSKSFYRCDQCHYEYSFRRTDLANLLLSQWTLLALTMMAFTTATFIGGFIVKLGLFLMPSSYSSGYGWYSSFNFFYTPLDAGTDILTAASALIPTIPRTWQDIFVIDVWHFVQGIISLGILGIVGFMGTGGIFSLRTFHPRRTRRQGDGLGIAEFAFILVIVLGCGKVAFSMWRRVKEMIQKRLADLGERILEVDPDRP